MRPSFIVPKCADEKSAARAAKSFVETYIGTGEVTISNIHYGKYAGRVVADMQIDGDDLAGALVEAGHAVAARRGKWCPAHAD